MKAQGRVKHCNVCNSHIQCISQCISALMQAHEAYSKAISLDANLLVAYNNRAMTSLKLSDWKGAEQDAEHVLSVDTSNVKALLRRATARYTLIYNH